MIMILKVLQYIMHGVNRRFDVEHHTKTFGQRPVILTCRQKWETCHWCMQASRSWNGVSKSTSWIMCWCRQEVTRPRGPWCIPHQWHEMSVMVLKIECDWWHNVQEWRSWKWRFINSSNDEVYWVTSLEHVSDTEWIGSIDPKPKRWMVW